MWSFRERHCSVSFPYYEEATDFLDKTLHLLRQSEVGYHAFFADIAQQLNAGWREDSQTILENADLSGIGWERWRTFYQKLLKQSGGADGIRDLGALESALALLGGVFSVTGAATTRTLPLA